MATPGATIDPISREDAAAIAEGRCGEPFSLLGAHPDGADWVVRSFVPGADAAALRRDSAPDVEMTRLHDGGLFSARLAARPGPYRIAARNDGGAWEAEDPYRFPPLLGEVDEHLISEGAHWRLWRALGAHPVVHDGVDGVSFAVWAPNARRVSVVGDFNRWDGRTHAMRRRGATGVWEIFAPGVGSGARYKFEIVGAGGALLPPKADPVGFGGELRPDNCSVVRALPPAKTPDDWRDRRRAAQRRDAPISIYEAHLGSWRRKADGGWLNFRELAETLVPYVADLGFTHLEALPITEHPFDGSWGYQPIGLFAPTSRHGDIDDFRAFVAACHAAGLHLILDWVPAHFPADDHGLAKFDGTSLYEYADPREGFHQDWNTLIYNFGRTEVQNFLIASALYWTREHGVDAIRVDAVASMLYRDYSRKDGEWIPNKDGGRENLEAIAFLKRFNTVLYGDDDSIATIAEESTAWPGVTRPVHDGGLGFGYKWNMGWMNDSLAYMAEDPMHRGAHHSKMTFGLHYAFSENFILPLSHDEVVHGKRSVVGKMPGDRTRRFANLRAYYAFMFAHPGKKLMFMGQEFGQEDEWNHDAQLPWDALDDPLHAGARTLVRDLNRLYRDHPALHLRDADESGFEWIDGSAEADCSLAWVRMGGAGSPSVLAIFNFSGVEHRDWRFGAPVAGEWTEILNTDAAKYGGATDAAAARLATEPEPSHGRKQSLVTTVPPLSALFFVHQA